MHVMYIFSLLMYLIQIIIFFLNLIHSFGAFISSHCYCFKTLSTLTKKMVGVTVQQ